ncbi:CRAL-TRIO domain-containing protein [Multifurca ochricompacta]|uniref:CRAL-TRIO domain-containing protein n=1 Tax=Multifurca ochricompacta TaxID=376703 RepID=A0AAD4M987_9AGAM|nr:CRAL-TRIO domain-containing protein [Multifurca ochricompacta]
MSVDHAVSRVIRAHNASLINLYSEHSETVRQLQKALLSQVLPNVVDELGLDNFARNWAEEWLQDDLSIFRTLKRHKFTKAFALESLREILTWRLSHLKSQDPTAFPPSPLHVLPRQASDILGRPVLILRLANLAALQRDPREHVLHSVEGLRLNLHHINSPSPSSARQDKPVLQYVLLVDMENASLSNFNLDLLTWYTHEVAPRYPGLFGTVFIINFSWTQSGIWSVIKLALPESVHHKIFFPSRDTLHDCISPSNLPHEFGGYLPPLPEIPNLLDAQQTAPTPSLSSSFSSLKGDDSISPTHPPTDSNTISASRSSHRKISPHAHISPRSQFSPFYGYPIGPSQYSLTPAALPYLRHGRRRKRDLIRTLAALWWEKWRSRVSWTFSLLFIFLSLQWWWRQRRKGVLFIRGGPNQVTR